MRGCWLCKRDPARAVGALYRREPHSARTVAPGFSLPARGCRPVLHPHFSPRGPQGQSGRRSSPSLPPGFRLPAPSILKRVLRGCQPIGLAVRPKPRLSATSPGLHQTGLPTPPSHRLSARDRLIQQRRAPGRPRGSRASRRCGSAHALGHSQAFQAARRRPRPGKAARV